MNNLKKYGDFVNEEFINPLIGVGVGVLIGLTGLGIQKIIRLIQHEPTKKLIKEIIEMINKYEGDPIIDDVIDKIENDETYGLKGSKDIQYLTKGIMNRFQELMEPDEFRTFKRKLEILMRKQVYNINLEDLGIFQL